MAEMTSRALNCHDWDELLTQITRTPDEIFPKLFPVIVEAAEKGDGAAKEILSQSATKLGRLATALIRRLGMSDAEFALTKCGGVFGRSALLDLQVDAALRAAAPHARISLLEISPAVGAAHMAARLPSSPQTASHGS